jgi:Kdo2-lipid IVA lauroyltransferase/acyltransferase
MTVPGALSLRGDLREGGRWSVAQRVKNALLYGVARAILVLVSSWSVRSLRATGRGLGRLAYVLLPGARRLTHQNLSRALPGLSARERTRLARDVFVELGGDLGDTVALLSPRHVLSPLPIEEGSRAVLDAAVREGRGVVFVSAHLGPWERVAASLVMAGFSLTTVAREGYDPRFTKLLDALRRRLGVRVIYRGSPGAHVRIVRTLREGGVLGAPMDLRSRVPSVLAPFLGHPAKTAIGPARIALRTGATVAVGTAAPSVASEGGAEATEGLRITVTRIETGGLPRGEAGEKALTVAINAELSCRILAMPRRWVWMHPRWVP